MATQSLAMGEAFGKGFQYGKRKISSMTNEEFNALNADDLGSDIMADYTKMIPHIENAMQQSKEFQSKIIQSLTETVLSIPKDVINQLQTTSTREIIEDTLFSNPPPSQDVGLILQNAFKNFALGGQTADASSGDTTTNTISDQEENYSRYTTAQLSSLRINYTKNGQTPPPGLTQEYQTRLAELRESKNEPVTKKSTITHVADKPLGRNEQQLHETLNKYFTLWKTAKDKAQDGFDKYNQHGAYKRKPGSMSPGAWKRQQSVGYTVWQRETKDAKNYAQIFNSKLKSAQNYKALTMWHGTKPLK